MDIQELHKEIDLIQGCIDRMAKNSFMIKGWALTIFAGVIAIGKTEIFNDTLLLICALLIPFLAFWILDAVFLHTERKYRKMYAWVLQERKKGNTEYQYDLDSSRFKKEAGRGICAFFSKTLALFYGIPTAVLVLLIIRSLLLVS